MSFSHISRQGRLGHLPGSSLASQWAERIGGQRSPQAKLSLESSATGLPSSCWSPGVPLVHFSTSGLTRRATHPPSSGTAWLESNLSVGLEVRAGEHESRDQFKPPPSSPRLLCICQSYEHKMVFYYVNSTFSDN